MHRISTLGVGAKFRVAHEEQFSCNRLKMHRNLVYVVDKIFSMSPYIRVCKIDGGQCRDIYTLTPDTPVLFPSEPPPTIEEIETYLLGKIQRRIPIGYRILYDGQGSDFLQHRLPKSAVKLVEDLYVTGIKIFSVQKIRKLLERRTISKTYNDYAVFASNRELLHEHGLIEILFEDNPEAASVLKEVLG